MIVDPTAPGLRASLPAARPVARAATFAFLCFCSQHPSAGRLNYDFIDDGQIVKKYKNHAYCVELALGYSEVCVGPKAG